MESDKLRGTYIDPAAGKLSFRQYAEQWLAAQTFDESTREVTERRLRRHIFPYLGNRTLATILPAHLRELDRALQRLGLAVTYRVVAYSNVATILNAAVDDGRIPRNPAMQRQSGHRRCHPARWCRGLGNRYSPSEPACRLATGSPST